MVRLPELSPVEKELATLPRGDGKWSGFDAVYDKLNKVARECFTGPYAHCGEEHVHVMAVMGCGHEETMKAEMFLLRSRFNLKY
jgi:hypothetical protein